MSIQSEIDRIVLAKTNLRVALKAKGATLTDGALLEDFVDAVNNLQMGEGSTELPTVSVTADKLLEGITAINSAGDVVTGNIPTVSLVQEGSTVYIDRGYTEGGRILIDNASEPDYYEATVTVSGNKVTITAGLIEAQTVTIPEGAVSLDGGYISVRAGYIGNDEIALPTSSSKVEGNEVTIYSGWVNMDYSTFVDDAEISYDDDRVVVGVGWVHEELVIEKGATSLPAVSFSAAGLREGMSAIDSSGNVVNGSMKNVSISIDGNNVYVRAGYVEETDVNLPLASISETDDYINIGVGWVSDERSFEKGTTSALPTVSVTADKLLSGVTAINSSGEVVTGTIASQSAKTWTPTTSNQSIAAGKYLSGKQTIKGDANLVAENIKSGVTIFNVAGSYTGSGSAAGGSSTFAKVTEFTPPREAYTAVTSVTVSGFGVGDTPWDGEVDFSDWNATYEDISGNTELRDMVYKHPTDEKYLYNTWDDNYEEYRWVFSESPSDPYYSCYFIRTELETGSWSSPYYDYEFSQSVTITKNSNSFPETPASLSGKLVTRQNDAWVEGGSIPLTSFTTSPVTNGIYLVEGSDLLGDAIDYDYEKWMPLNGLISYFPMSGNAIAAADYVSRVKLFPRGNGVESGEDAWYGNGKGGSLVGTFSTVPKEFTLCLKFRMDDWVGDYEHELPLLQYEAGFGIFVRSNNKVRTLVENEWAEEFDMDRETDYTVFLLYDGDNVRTYCTYNGGELWHDNLRSGYNPPDKFAWQVMSLGYPEHMTFTGKIWDIMLYDRVLSDNEIAVIANR